MRTESLQISPAPAHPLRSAGPCHAGHTGLGRERLSEHLRLHRPCGGGSTEPTAGVAARPADTYEAAEEAAPQTRRCTKRPEENHQASESRPAGEPRLGVDGDPLPSSTPRLGEVFALERLSDVQRRAHETYRPEGARPGELVDVLM